MRWHSTVCARLSSDSSELLSPGVGIWRGCPKDGAIVGPDQLIGELVVLDEVFALKTPADTPVGIMRLAHSGASARAIDWTTRLVTIEKLETLEGQVSQSKAPGKHEAGNFFCAPSSGRFWARPAPDKPPLASAGDTVTEGEHVCILEVMKTFTRVPYGGAGMPVPGEIVRTCVQDGDDVAEGQPLFEVRPA